MRKIRGVTLFEVLLVLFVAAFIVVAVATIYNRVDTTYKENALFSDIQELASGVRALYANEGYSGLNYDDAEAAGIIPAGMRANVTKFGTDWSFTPNPTTTEFSITIDGVGSKDSCINMATKGMTLSNMKVANQDVDTVAKAATVCTDTSSITFTFR